MILENNWTHQFTNKPTACQGPSYLKSPLSSLPPS